MNNQKKIEFLWKKLVDVEQYIQFGIPAQLKNATSISGEDFTPVIEGYKAFRNNKIYLSQKSAVAVESAFNVVQLELNNFLDILREGVSIPVSDVDARDLVASRAESQLNFALKSYREKLDEIAFSLQGEEQGLNYGGLQLEILKSPLIDDADGKSIKNALTLYKSGQYLDGLKVIFPCIERVLNKILQEMGQQPDKYPGWKKKVDYLESTRVIPPDVAKAIEIITSRNKILHGQFVPPDPEYAHPIFQMAIIYLHRILSAWSKFKSDI